MDILTHNANSILTIEFNRLHKKNALTAAMYRTLVSTLQEAQNDPTVRVILITGKPQIFTAGNDLDEFLNDPPQGSDSPVFQFLLQLHHATKPIVAAVAGSAMGIGTTLLLHCDLVYAADNTRFAMPFAQLGLCPEGASSLLLPQIAGYQRAAEKLLLGEAFSAEEAREMGLVNKVLPAEDVLAYAQAQAVKLAALPATSVRATKRLMRQQHSALIDAQLEQERQQFSQMLLTPEAKEAFSAFLEKRKPDFAQFS